MANPILNAGLYYVGKGFEVFPVHGIANNGNCTCGDPACGNKGKHPATLRGLLDSSKDPKKIEQFFKGTQYNIAIRTGAESGIFVLDIDGVEGETSLFKLLAEYGPLPDTMHSLTSRGRHLIFKHPNKKVITRTSKLACGAILGVDTRGDGGYIVAPPSRHLSGVNYTLIEKDIAEAPEWLIKLVTEEAPRAVQAIPAASSATQGVGLSGFQWSVDEVRDMLAVLDPDMAYDEWLHVGMALKEGNYPIQLWDEWSRRGSKYKQGDCLKRYGKFTGDGGITMGTLVDMAKMHGWTQRARYEDVPIENHPARLFLEKLKREADARQPILPPAVQQGDGFKAPPVVFTGEPAAPAHIGQFVDPLKIDGIVGDTIRWITDTAIKPQPELAMLNVLAALGAVFGRRYATPINTRTNLYTIGLAGTGSGKDHSRKQVKELLNRAGLANCVGGDRIKSGAGILTSLVKQPSQVMHLDEFGLVLQNLGNNKASSHLTEAAKHILELYSTSGSSYNIGQGANVDADASVIHAPNLCLFGTSTVEDYAAALTERSITSGQLNRFIIIRVKTDIPQRRFDVLHQDIPQNILDAWTRFRPTLEAGGQKLPETSVTRPTPIIVNWDEVKSRIYMMQNYEDEKMREGQRASPLWNRYAENAIKIAMILAIARDPARPRMVPIDIEVGEAITRQSIEFSVKFSSEYIAESEHQRDCQSVYRAIQQEGGTCSMTEIARRVRKLDAKKRASALISLQDQGMIVVTTGEGDQGRKISLFTISNSD